MAETRAATKLSQEQREEMVERFLRGEDRATVAAAFGVDKSLPSLRAYTWGFVDQRLARVRPHDLTEEGRAWLAKRPAKSPEQTP